MYICIYVYMYIYILIFGSQFSVICFDFRKLYILTSESRHSKIIFGCDVRDFS